mmetsp:Transcript_86228/g.149213  ORF Transcript_86228/g.149213 Transcript_86228/m.149213 type:complete len:624 (+) Transcript_86228:114-1985(+)
MLAESENFSDGEEDEEVEDEVAHAEKLAKEKWVVEDQCKWTIFEDPADELRYHRRRSRALGYFVRAFRYFREESERLHEAGAGLQDAYERLQEENKEAIGDAAYWRELAEARAEQSTVGSAIIREPPPSLDTAGNDETSSRISLAQSEPATVDCSVERFESAEITMRFDVASSSAGEEELVPSEVRPSLRRKSMPAASASDLEPPQTCEAWESQSTMISALSTVREEATRWRKVAEQRGEELLSLRQQYNALSSPGSASCSPGARSWHRHSTTTSTAGGTSAVSSVAAASSQCSQKRRSCGPGSTPPPSFRTLPGTAAMGACVGNVGGRDGASPRRQGAPKSAPSSPKPGAAAFRQVQAPGLATHTTRASSPRREVVHEQDRAAGEQPVTLNQHEQEKREWSGSPRQISIPPSPHREKKTSSREASGEEELQMEKLAGTSNTETTLAAPTTNLVRDVATPSRASAPARRLSGPRTPMRRKVTLQFLGLIVCLLAVTWALDSLKVVSVRRMSCTLATAAENALGRPRAPALVTSLQEQLCRGWEAERQPYEPAQPDDDMRDDKFDKEIKDDKDDKDNKDDDANNEKSKEDDSADEQAAWSSVKGLPRWLPPCAGMSPTMCILSR